MDVNKKINIICTTINNLNLVKNNTNLNITEILSYYNYLNMENTMSNPTSNVVIEESYEENVDMMDIDYSTDMDNSLDSNLEVSNVHNIEVLDDINTTFDDKTVTYTVEENDDNTTDKNPIFSISEDDETLTENNILLQLNNLILKKKPNCVCELNDNNDYINKFNIYPPKFIPLDERLYFNPGINKFIEEQTSVLWTVDEIEYDMQDIEKFFNLKTEHKNLIQSIILYFLFADKLVISNLDEIKNIPPYESVKHYYIVQEYIESVHDRIYKKSGMVYYNDDQKFINDSLLLEQIINTAEYYNNEIFDLNNFICPYLEQKSEDEKNIFYAVALKINLINKWKNISSYLHKLVAFFTIESISFNCLFIIINLFKTNNDGLKYLVSINELVSRDESIHALFGLVLYKNYIVNKLPEEEVIYIVKNITEVEIQFLRMMMPDDFKIKNYNIEHFIDYLKNLANKILNVLNIKDIYEINNTIPVEFTNQNLKIKTNFFERFSLYITDKKYITAKQVLDLY